MKERLIELETLLTSECGKYENDCTKCPYNEKCNEYARLSEEAKHENNIQ